MNQQIIEKLMDKGGKRWTKAPHDRIYLNTDVCAKLIGLTYTTYKTGSVSSATYEGESISHSHACDILTAFDKGRLYYDVVDDKFRWYSADDRSRGWCTKAVEAARNLVNE